MESAKEIQIGELAKRTGVKIETIRYYERSGIMPKPPRTAGGFRVYRNEHVSRLMFVKRCRQLGFSMRDIASLLELVDVHDYTCGEVRDLTLGHADMVKLKVADLIRLENALRSIASQCTGDDVPECPVIDALLDADNQIGLTRQ